MNGAVAIIPVGTVTKSFCRELATAVGSVLSREVEILPASAEPQYAFNPARGQYHSTAIVRRVAQTIDRKKHAMGVGIVEVDLFLPDLNFVFGEADRDERAAVVSLARLLPSYYGRPDDHAKTMQRTVSETLHEVGHVFGLTHCQNDTCAMFFSNTLSDTDRKRGAFCDGCRDRLGRGLDL
jgi:archaemetzincin